MKKISKKKIEGMIIVLEKLYPKLSMETAAYIIAEANDITNLNGYFKIDDEHKVHFVKTKNI
jgi:hypothetical protein